MEKMPKKSKILVKNTKNHKKMGENHSSLTKNQKIKKSKNQKINKKIIFQKKH